MSAAIETIWKTLKSVIPMESHIERLATTAREQQAKVESLTARVIRLEAQLDMPTTGCSTASHCCRRIGWLCFERPRRPTGRCAQAALRRGLLVLDSRQGLPSGTFAMEGSRGQYAIIVPSANVIVVRRGFDPLDARFDIDRFTHDVLGVLKMEGGRQ